MKRVRFWVLCGLLCGLSSCFSREEKKAEVRPEPVASAIPANKPAKNAKEPAASKDKSLDALVRYFEQADSIHREAWWVLTSERRPVSKSPFGKVQRALLSSQNIKLSNKSLFRCDRYVVQRDVMGVTGYPQRADIFEKCSEKTAAKKIAQVFVPSENEIQVTFFPENLEEILGLGATVLNRSIPCTLKGNEHLQLVSLKCKDWAQDRSKEQMIRLDVYDYEKAGKNLIKLRGKVYENLSDTRKIEADVPMEGKIYVTETELYPPEAPTPKPSPSPSATAAASPSPGATVAPAEPGRVPGAPPLVLPPEQTPAAPPTAEEVTPLLDEQGNPAIPAPRGGVDPDVLMQRQQQGVEPMHEDQEMIEAPQEPSGTLGAPQPEAGGVRAR